MLADRKCEGVRTRTLKDEKCRKGLEPVLIG